MQPTTYDAAARSAVVRESIKICGVDVTEALRLLKQAGCPNPMASGLDDASVLQRLVDALCSLSLIDGLTGLANGRQFWASLEREVERAARTGETCALLMIDVDRFKSVNDTYGHPVGDTVLRHIAARLAENLRPMDTVARYGGEEFAVILPNSPSAYAVQVAERLRLGIAGNQLVVSPEISLSISISVGVACTVPWTPPHAERLVEQADDNLYEAKAGGRNRVCAVRRATAALSNEEKAELFKSPPPE